MLKPPEFLLVNGLISYRLIGMFNHFTLFTFQPNNKVDLSKKKKIKRMSKVSSQSLRDKLFCFPCLSPRRIGM